jgi:hypothetical protein
VNDAVVSWARTYSAVHDAMIYRRFDGPLPERARFAVIHDRDVPPRVKEFLAEKGGSVCADIGDSCVPIFPDPVSTQKRQQPKA